MRFIHYIAAGLSTALAVFVPRGGLASRALGTHNSTIGGNSTNAPLTPSSSSSTYWLDQMDHSTDYAPLAGSGYKVYRNVVNDYGAANDGSSDASAAINKAISDGNRQGSTTTPAEVFLPGGTYRLDNTVNLKMFTIIIGDPNNPPVLKASAGFNGNTVVNGYDPTTGHPEDSFMTQLRNVHIDTTSVSASTSLTALQWGVAQGCATGNLNITMPDVNSQHTGINLSGGSTIAVADVRITGGLVGIRNSNQQVNFKNIYFKDCTTAYVPSGGWTSVVQGATFDTCGFGIDMTQGSAGDVVLLDSVSTNSGIVIKFTDSSNAGGNRNNQVVIENLTHDTNNPIAQASGRTVLSATSHVDTWAWGNITPGVYTTGDTLTTNRPSALLGSDGKFFMADTPTFAGYSASQVVNVKQVSGHTVNGNGQDDDSAALNAILAANAQAGKVTFFPYGVYILESTLYIPPGSRIMGDAFTVLSGKGSNFANANSPMPVVQVGKPGDTGVAQIMDFRFTVDEVSPGAKIVEVNMAGNPGDVGIWNSVITIGGTADSNVANQCTKQHTQSCMAAWGALHLTSSSSAYIQNVWVWTADHDLDGGPIQIISTGRGILVEATKATWLVGTGSEHNWLYNYNIHNAQNVFAGMQQTETPYMQGDGAVLLAPAPWTADSSVGDPDFSWCGGGDGKCRSSLANNIDGGSHIYLYGGAHWAFFNGTWDGAYDHPCPGTCQTNMARVANSPSSFSWYGINTKSADIMVLDGQSNPSQYNHPGSWGGDLVAYRQFS